MYTVKSDPMNWILVETHTVQDKKSKNFGKEQERNIGYFPDLQTLKHAAVERSLKIHGLEGLEAAKAELMGLVQPQ